MGTFYSFLFDILTDPLGLPINALYEYLILAFVGAIAFRIAWETSPGGFGGSTIHWSVRLIAFVAIWAVIYFVIWLGKLVIANWITVLCVIAGLAVIGITTYLISHSKKGGKANA